MTRPQESLPVPTPVGERNSRLAGDSTRKLDSVQFKDALLTQVMQLLMEEGAISIHASAKAQTKRLTIDLKYLTAEEALRAIADANGLVVHRDRTNGIFYVYTFEERPRDKWDIETLRQFERELNEAFPDSIVKLSLVGQQIVVRGQAHDVIEASRILKLVELEVQSKDPPDQRPAMQANGIQYNSPFASMMPSLTPSKPPLQVLDMLTVLGEQQVSLRVTVAEVSRNAARSIGLNFGLKSKGNTPIQVFRSALNSSTGNLPTMLDNGQIQLAITALRTLSLSRTLAEPTLTALNGQQASFHVGGKFPVPLIATGISANGAQGVTYIPFGIQLQFTPYVTDRDLIRLSINAEVSSQSGSTSIGGASNGTAVPGLTQSQFQSTVELREGQTLAVAGLIKNDYGASASRVPFFGDLPIVGRAAAFDSVSNGEQELVILVTPEFVHALNPAEAPSLPGSDIFEPDDIAFYLGAQIEGSRNEDFRSSARTDLHRMDRYRAEQDLFIIGPQGYTQCGPLPGVYR